MAPDFTRIVGVRILFYVMFPSIELIQKYWDIEHSKKPTPTKTKVTIHAYHTQSGSVRDR